MSGAKAAPAWEQVFQHRVDAIERFPVPGGWLYRVHTDYPGQEGWDIAVVFVPAPPAVPAPAQPFVPYFEIKEPRTGGDEYLPPVMPPRTAP